MNADVGVIISLASHGVTPTRQISLCSLLRVILSPLLCITQTVWRKVPSRDWLSTPKIDFSSPLAWVAVTCISVSELPNFILSSIFISHTVGSGLVSWRKKVTFIKALPGPYSKQNTAASSDPCDMTPCEDPREHMCSLLWRRWLYLLLWHLPQGINDAIWWHNS